MAWVRAGGKFPLPVGSPSLLRNTIIRRSQFPYYEKNAAGRRLAKIPYWRCVFRLRLGPQLKAGPSSKVTSLRARKQFAASSSLHWRLKLKEKISTTSRSTNPPYPLSRLAQFTRRSTASLQRQRGLQWRVFKATSHLGVLLNDENGGGTTPQAAADAKAPFVRPKAFAFKSRRLSEKRFEAGITEKRIYKTKPISLVIPDAGLVQSGQGTLRSNARASCNSVRTYRRSSNAFRV